MHSGNYVNGDMLYFLSNASKGENILWSLLVLFTGFIIWVKLQDYLYLIVVNQQFTFRQKFSLIFRREEVMEYYLCFSQNSAVC